MFVHEGHTQDVHLVTTGCDFPEGPAWDGYGNIFVSNCYSDWIMRISAERVDTFVVKPTQLINFGKTNGLTFFRDGSIYACDYGLGAIVRFTSDGNCSLVIKGYERKSFNRPNDLAFDPQGNLYFTDPKSYGADMKDGRLFAYFAEQKRLVLLKDSLAFPNGIAFSADGKSLYVCESALARILQFRVLDDGTIDEASVFIVLPGGDPDGIALDVNGNLYVAHFGSGTVFVLSPDGEILREIELPGKKPTNVEFGDKDLKTLYITEAETNSVYRISNSVAGQKLHASP
jgi:gluconolactonase